MPPPATNPAFFATTRWTVVCEAVHGDEGSAAEALEVLCAAYWQPLYLYVRRLGRPAPEAEDLVQGFFADLLEHRRLRLADRERGRFRAFLLGSLKNYMAKEWHREHRLKRGGFAQHLSIDWQSAESGTAIDPADPRSPDVLYDRDWAMVLLDRVLLEMAQEEKDSDFERWMPFLSVSSAQISYAEIGAQFGLSEGAARVAVHRLRKRYRQRLREEVGRTLQREENVGDEMRALFAALTSNGSP